MIYYLWWMPLLLVVYALQAWLSVKNTGNGSYGIYLWLSSMIPLWAIVSRHYKKEELNLIGGIYDILFMTFQVTWIILGCTNGFNRVQWIGIILVTIGFILIKINME